MRSKVTLPWNAAAWRQSTYEPRVRKVHGPVGEHQPVGQVGQCSVTCPDGTEDARACQFCGYHVCSCERLIGIKANAGDVWATATKLPKPEPREYMSRAALYARKYGVGVPVPAEPTLCIPPHELKLMKEQLERQQRIAPVPPNPGPAGPQSGSLFGINADPAAPSWREYESKPLTREMYDRFYGIK